MENRIIQKYIHEELAKAIIAESLISFNENYIMKEDNNFRYEKVSTGLKLKPGNLSKHLFSDILYAINKDYDNVSGRENNHNLQKYIREAIIAKDEILKMVNKKEFYQYLNYCFTSLTFTSYFNYIQVLKRKIFDFYGERTIHHYSYLRKSKIEGDLNRKELDSVEAVTFFNENKKLYWLAASFRVFSEENREKDSLTVLRNILRENGLSKKGLNFLIKQSEHYITRFAQSLDVGIFCANFKLKDAWLRNYNLKKLLSFVKERRIYISLGYLCKNWKKPVSKFNYLNTKILKMLSSCSSIAFKKEILSMVKNHVLLKNSDALDLCKYYIDNSYSYHYNSFYILHKIAFCDVILDDVEDKISLLGKKHQKDNIFLTKESVYYNAFLEILNENNLKADIDFFQYRDITLKELKQKFSKIITDALKKDEEEKFKEERNNCINIIKENFGNNIFIYIKELELDRDIFNDEFVDDDLFMRNYDENPYMIQEAIKIVPFSGDNYISKYKEFLRKKGVTKSAWKNIHHLYKEKSTTISAFLGIDNITSSHGIENIVYFFNNKIDLSNYALYNDLICKHYYSSSFLSRNEEIRNHNLNLLFIHLIKKMQSPVLIKMNEFILDIIPENRTKIYERIIQRGQGIGRGGEITKYSLAERDFHSMIDYLSTIDHKVNYKSINGIIEASNQWHEENYYNNLPYKVFKEENVGYVIIDKKYEFKQLVNTNELRKESAVMHHCVANYNDRCAKNEYIVYHMTNIENSERATLGISKNLKGYTFDQMYAEYNNFISEEEINAGKYIVYCLNHLHSSSLKFSEDDLVVTNVEEDEIIF